MSNANQDTIAAIATPPGRGGVGVIRVSGPDVKKVMKTLLGVELKPRYATFLPFKNKEETIDEGIALFFPGPNSFTGEDVLELQGHGGPVVLDAVLRAAFTAGARPAQPGEFSERAFLNGRMDLTQAEAVADLIDASSTQAARSAVRSLQGEFSFKIKALLDALIDIRKFVEASIDFTDEDIDFLSEEGVQGKLESLLAKTEVVSKTARQGALLQSGMQVVIAGKPNAGKSSLLNALSGRDSAIVTDIAGTTRDTLREHIHIDGMPLHIIDTAGLRETSDVVEQEGVRRAYEQIQQADVLLFIVDGTSVSESEIPTLAQSLQKSISKTLPIVIVKNKIDLMGEEPKVTTLGSWPVIALSAKGHQGLDALREKLKQHMGYEQSGEDIFIARARHLEALEQATQSIARAIVELKEYQAPELLAEELRAAQQALSRITGEFTSEDLLGEIFSNFCVGK